MFLQLRRVKRFILRWENFEKGQQKVFVIVQATCIRGVAWEQTGGKDFAKVLFNSSVRKTGCKLILSQYIGKLRIVVLEARDPGVLDFKCPLHQRSY